MKFVAVIVFFAGFAAHAEQARDRNFADLKAVLVQASKASSFKIDDALKALKQKPEFQAHFQHYTLVKNSFSIQGGDPVSPRVLMFGETASLVMSFNGSNQQTGGNTLETAEYDEASHRIRFRNIIFKDETSQNPSIDPKEIDFENDRILITKANPPMCMQCHALSLTDNHEFGVSRYIWNSYSQWPRFYGSNDDLLTDEEVTQFKKFKQSAVQNIRYRELIGLDRPNFPYATGDVQSQSINGRPNLALTTFLAHRQADELAELLHSRLSKEDSDKFVFSVLCDLNTTISEEKITQLLALEPIEYVMSTDRETTEFPGGNTKDGFNIGYVTLLFSPSVDNQSLFAAVKQAYTLQNINRLPLSVAASIENTAATRKGSYDGLSVLQFNYLKPRIDNYDVELGSFCAKR